MAKQRDPVIDSMRGIGIVLMVLGHSGFPGTDFIYLVPHGAVFYAQRLAFQPARRAGAHFVKRKSSRSGCPLCWQTPPLPC